MKIPNAPVGAYLSIIVTVGIGSAPAADWYRWRGPDLNGISVETEWQSEWLDEDPPTTWRASVGTGFSSVTVADGRLFCVCCGMNCDVVLVLPLL